MKFFDYIGMAFQNLWRRKLRSFLTISAVVIGAVAVLTLVTLVVTASSVFRKQLESIGALTAITVTSDTDVTADDYGSSGGGNQQGKKLDDTVIADIERLPHVVAVSASSYVWAFQSVKFEGTEKRYDAQVQAYQVNAAATQAIVAGRELVSGDKNQVVIGEWYVKKFGYEGRVDELVGKKVIFTTFPGFSGIGVDLPQPPADMHGDKEKMWWEDQNKKVYEFPAEIVGVLQSGPGSGDRSMLITMEWGKDLMTRRYWKDDEEARQAEEQQGIYSKQPILKLFTESELDQKGYQYLTAKADSTDTVASVAAAIKTMNLGAITAQDFLEQISKIFKIVGLIFGAIGGISLGVASLGIINTMVMSMYERTREIGVMRACGARKKTIRKLFTFEAALIGFSGGVIGVGILFVLVAVGNIYGNQFLLDQNIGLQNIIDPPLWLVLGVIAFTTLIGLLAGLYPAFKAARLNPVDALRYE